MAFYRKHVSLCIEMRLFPDKSESEYVSVAGFTQNCDSEDSYWHNKTKTVNAVKSEP